MILKLGLTACLIYLAGGFLLPAPLQASDLQPKSVFSEDYSKLVAELELSELASALVDQREALICGGTREFLFSIGLSGDELNSESVSEWRLKDPIYSAIRALKTELSAVEDSTKTTRVQFIHWLQLAVAEGLTTGYNVMPYSAWPDFDFDRTIIYGHSSPKHALQLLMLLRVRGIEPEFKFVLKRSGFLYRDGWGGSSQDLLMLPSGERMIQAHEFDLFLQFTGPEDRLYFESLVSEFAKRDERGQTGLIYHAWWQPFYRSFNNFGDMAAASVIIARYGGYRSNLMVDLNDAETRTERLEVRFPEIEFSTEAIWVNPSFYRYIQGGFR